MQKFAILLLLLAAPAAGAEVTPDQALLDIFGACEIAERAREGGMSHQDFFDAGVCYGFLLGWIQGRAPRATRTFCAPAMTHHQMILVFNAYVRRFPAWRVKSTGDAFDAAMEEAFPCSAK